MTKINRTNQQLSDQSLLAGVQSNPQSFPFLTAGGKTVTVAEAIAILQARIETTNRVASTRTLWQAALKAEEDQRAATHAIVLNLRRALQAAFADSPDELGKYGLLPRKAPAVSVHTRVVAAAKARATRTARHTMGSKQKKSVKGDVTGVIVTPSLRSAPTATPAPSAGGPAPAGGSSPHGT